MLFGFHTAATALDSFQRSLDVSANNLSNINSTAFKRSVIDFQELQDTGDHLNQVGRGVFVSSISSRDFQQGPALFTGNELDVMIDGQGFFAVQTPDGSIQYTRDGAFHRDVLGRMVTTEGHILQPPITFPADTRNISIDEHGIVSVLTGSSPTAPQILGQITLTNFQNIEGLRAETGNRYSETASSGSPTSSPPGTNAAGIVKQRNLEQSNVDVTSEMTTLIAAQRAYGINSKSLQASNELLTSAYQLIQ